MARSAGRIWVGWEEEVEPLPGGGRRARAAEVKVEVVGGRGGALGRILDVAGDFERDCVRGRGRGLAVLAD